MLTRRESVAHFWPYSRDLEINFKLIGRLPPTEEDVMVAFRSLHQHNQEDPGRKNRQSTLEEAAKQIATSAQDWWIKAGYKVRKQNDLYKTILKLDSVWKVLSRDHNQITKGKKKLTPAIQLKQQQFVINGKKTFRVVTYSYEKYLEASHDLTEDMTAKEKFKEDLEYLRNMHDLVGDARYGAVGSFDKALASTSSNSQPKPSKPTPPKPSKSTPAIPDTAQDVTDTDQGISSYIDPDSSSDNDTSDSASMSSGNSYEPYYKKKKDNCVVLNVDKNALKESSLQSDVDGVSVRQQLRYTSTFIQSCGGMIDDISVSRTSLERFRKQAREKKAGDVREKENTLLQEEYRKYVLCWDGKTFKSKTHAGKKKPVLAVVLKCIQDGEEILVDVINMTDKSGADMECQSVIDALNELGFDITKILALVFDTTAVNSGHRTGVTVQLQCHIDHCILQIACRHHIMELVCGGAASTVYGDTESPCESVFKSFANVWHSINRQDYRTFQSTDRKLKAATEAALEMLMGWLRDSTNLREDYKKLLELTILFLGGTFPSQYRFTFKAPGAFTHSRWMARIIYTLMIALFQHQLEHISEFAEYDLDRIWSLAAFLSLYYVRYWFLSPNLADAAVNDLEMWNNLNDIMLLSSQHIRNYPCHFKEMAAAAQQKLNNHLWFLTERHIIFALASDRVSIAVKTQMINKLRSFRLSSTPAAVIGNGLVQMPVLQKSTRLPDLIGPDSFSFFDILPQFDILQHSNPRVWYTLDEYALFQSLIKNMPATNDVCERALGMATEIQKRATAPKSDEQMDNIIKVTHSYRAAVRAQAKHALGNSKKADTTTKSFLKNFRW